MDKEVAAVDDKVLGRIKKMLALAQDTAASEGERENALRMSYALLAKHNLSMSQVDAHGVQQEEVREAGKATFVVYPWARRIAQDISQLFFCKYYFMRSGVGKQATHVFIGKQSNAQTAQYMAEFVVRSVLKEASKLYGSAIAPLAREFAVGVSGAIYKRVQEIQASFNEKAEPGTALVLVNLHKSEQEANAAWLASMGVKLKAGVNRQKGVHDNDAYRAGKDFGSKVSLSPQIAATRDNKKLLA